MELLIGEIFLKALVMCGILYLVARHEADFEFSKVVIVTCGITLGGFIINSALILSLVQFMPKIAASIVSWLAVTAFVTFMVVRFCWVQLWKGVIIAIIFMGFSVGLGLLGSMLVANINGSVEQAGGTKMERNNREALQIFKEMMGTSTSQLMAQAAHDGVMPRPSPGAPAGESVAVSSNDASRSQSAGSIDTIVPQKKKPPLPPKTMNELPDFAKTPGWEEARSKIKVSAVLVERDGSNSVIVNGEVLGIGDILFVNVDNREYQFKVVQITTDWVAWDPVEEDQEENPN